MSPAKIPIRDNTEVVEFIEQLDQPLRDQVSQIRRLMLDSHDEITERIKWKAPSFCIDGDDRITMRLMPAGGIQLIFHRGAKVKDASGFEFSDPTGLMKWAARDRAVVMLDDSVAVTSNASAITDLAARWVETTR